MVALLYRVALGTGSQPPVQSVFLVTMEIETMNLNAK